MPVKTTKVPDSEATKTSKSTDKPEIDDSTSENKPDGSFFGDKPETPEAEAPEAPEEASKGSEGDEAEESAPTNTEKVQGTEEEQHERDTREAISGDNKPTEEDLGEEGADEPEDPRDARIARLEKIIEDMSKSVDTDIKDSQPAKEEPEKGAEAASALIGDMSDDDFDRITTSKKAFTDFLSKFGDKLIAKSSESTLRTVPDVINKSIKRQSRLNNAITDFYDKNPDLKSHAKYVGYMFTQKQSENPDKDLDTLFNETEKEVRKNLQLNKTAVDRENQRLKNKQTNQTSRPAKPGSGRSGSRTAPADTRTEQQKQIDDILI